MNESLLRTVYIILAQVAIMAVITSVLWYFGRIYKRKYLQTWSISTFGFCLSALAIALLTGRLVETAAARTVASIFSLLTHNFHVFFLLLGSYEAVSDQTMERKKLRVWLAIIFAISFLPLLYSSNPADATIRYALRIGLRELITSLGFIAASIMLGKSRQLSTMGARLVTFSLFLYGAAHSYYVVVITQNIAGNTQQLPSFFGVAETVLLSCIGFGLVIWLLEDERGRLQKINKELDSFLYSASHDLRSPLASILGLTNLARLEITDPKSQEYIGMIDGRIKKLDAVIGDILHLSRSTKAQLKIEKINFNQLMKDVASDVKFNSGAAKIALRYEENERNSFIGDYTQMKIVLSNLIGNAVKYHRVNQPDPFIAVRFKKSRSKVVFEVEDNGEGIALDQQEKVFEMFHRASGSTDGTGLGLYIVKEALAKVNGSISLRSQERVGSTFTVILPQP